MRTIAHRLAHRVAMMLGIGRQTADTNETSGAATIQVGLMGGELREGFPLIQDYGLCSRPLAGADLIVLFATSDRMRGVAVASNDQRYRPRDLQPGDVCLYNQTGSRILLSADGSITISPSGKKLTIDADVAVTGNLVADGEVTGNGVPLSTHLTTDVTSGSGVSGPPQKSV